MSGTNLVLARASAPAHSKITHMRAIKTVSLLNTPFLIFFTIAEKNTYENRKGPFKFELKMFALLPRHPRRRPRIRSHRRWRRGFPPGSLIGNRSGHLRFSVCLHLCN